MAFMSTQEFLSPSMRAKISGPDEYTLPPTKHVPNSPMPILVYRDVLPKPRTEQTVQEFIERHGWQRKGILWPAEFRRHFHPNTHECYAIVSGSSKVLMGVGKLDNVKFDSMDEMTESDVGLILTLNEGDVIVHPAGTAHSSLTAESNYRYLSFFPEGAPHWISCNGDAPLDLAGTLKETISVPMPSDPVHGNNGHLNRIWEEAKSKYFDSSSTNV